MLNIQKYLLDNSLRQLELQHGVYARWSSKNPKKFCLNYDQYEANTGDPVANECRGLILEMSCINNCRCHSGLGETKVLAYPFSRFLNFGQDGAAELDWNSVTYFEKLDGTLCNVYYDVTLAEWCVATRSSSEADVPFENIFKKTFRMLFENAVNKQYNLSFSDFCKEKLSEGRTYMFELCTPENQIVVKHNDYKVWLLGARDINNFQEVKIETFTPLLEVCPSYKLSSDALVDFVTSRNPGEYEGIVCRDDNFQRLKVKDPKYGYFNMVRDLVMKSPRSTLELILLEKDDDASVNLSDDLKAVIATQKQNLQHWVKTENIHFGMLKLISNSRKEFAVNCQNGNGNISVQMFMYEEKGNANDWIRSHQKDGEYPSKFLDSLLKLISKG